MNRNELVEWIIDFILKYRINSTIEVDGTTILYLCWNKCNNHIEVEGFDTENIYIRKYINSTEVTHSKIIKLAEAPYKILKKLYDFLKNNQSKIEKKK
jgi:hypothetical protein